MERLFDASVLAELRQRFLEGRSGTSSDYWTLKNLNAYDSTFGARIGWKWEAVLKELIALGWKPTGAKIIDWGCGTGVASRAFFKAFPPIRLEEAQLWDRSPAAMAFAHAKFQEQEKPPRIELLKNPPVNSHGATVLLSHVLGELGNDDLSSVLSALETAESIIWVEPGTSEISHQLIQIRERLRSIFCVVAPCPHQNACGLFPEDRRSDWCHHFASPPPIAYQSAFWRFFGQELRIDLRSLPTSFLALDRRFTVKHKLNARVIGNPRVYKGYAKCLLCKAGTVREHTLLKRKNPALFRSMKETVFSRFSDAQEFQPCFDPPSQGGED